MPAKDWPLAKWWDAHAGEDIWMVCRNGHLWQAVCPYYYDFDDDFVLGRMRKASRARIRAVRKCRMCEVLKESGFKHLRGITKVCPDWKGVITEARMLADGTIEHHQPAQVAQAYSEEEVKNWAALLALISIQASIERRRKNQK